MKQAKLQIHPPTIHRKCQFGACQEDLAFVIDGIDLCFEHGRLELNRKLESDQKPSITDWPTKQLELIK